MQITILQVCRFKSLHDVVLNLSPFSVITGPNGSGKSNLFEALTFLGEIYRFGFEYALGRFGGIEGISFRGKRRTSKGVEFSVTSSMLLSELQEVLKHRLELQKEYGTTRIQIKHCFLLKPASATSDQPFSIDNETLELSGNIMDENVTILKITAKSGLVPEVFTAHPGTPSKEAIDVSTLVLGNNLLRYLTTLGEDTSEFKSGIVDFFRFSPIMRQYKNRMSLLLGYRLNPDKLRQPAVLMPNAVLGSHGENLPAVVERITREQPGVWEKVIAGMQSIVPGLEKITTESSPDRDLGLILRFVESGKTRPWSAYEVSDGTLHALALLLLLHDPLPPLVLIEEPENAVHPWVIRRFLETCRELNNKQVILTTHSPILLKLVKPEEVFLMWRSQEKSKLSPLLSVRPEVKELYYDKGFDVFELYDSGLIEEVIPGVDERSI